MAQFILVYTHPTEGEQRFELVSGRSYRIGSRPDNDIVIDQKDVSRRHAVLRVQDGAFHITDLDSKNGSFINGAKTVSETFNCGDMVHLSSARLVIVEVGTGSYPTSPEVIARRNDDSGASAREDTQKFRSEASMEDVVSLLETTASAVRRGALADPLSWAVDHLGFDGAVVLYRDDNDSVAMVSSAGDLGQLARKSSVLTKLATEHRLSSAAGTRVRQVSELGESLLVATVGSDHVLVVRYAGQPPAIGDLRSVIAAVSAVLGSGRVLRHGTVSTVVGLGQGEQSSGDPLNRIAGLSEAIVECKRSIVEIAQQPGPVVIVGERGSGMSLAARAIHDLSIRAAAPFVTIDLEGSDGKSIEARLVGDGEAVAGAESAEGGTLVFDHVSEMPKQTWDAIRAAISDRSAEVPRLVVNWISAAGNGSTEPQVGCLDADVVGVPNLRRRRLDIPILVSRFSQLNGGIGQGQPVSFSPGVLNALMSYGWPGNVGELKSETMKAIANAHPRSLVDADDLSDEVRSPQGMDQVPNLDLESLVGVELAEARNVFEEWIIRRAIAASGGKQTSAAKNLGLSRAGLFKKMRKLGL